MRVESIPASYETPQSRGCPLAVLLMVASAVGPCLFFKRKGWL